MTLSEEVAIEIADFFSAFSDKSRAKILSVLLDGEKNVGSIAEAIDLSESAVSHHLRILRQLRIVKMMKIGRQVYYSMDDEHISHIFTAGLDHVRHF